MKPNPADNPADRPAARQIDEELSRFESIEQHAYSAPGGTWSVDSLGLAFGRDALSAAASAARRAHFHHMRRLDAQDRAERLRTALGDAECAATRIIAEANLTEAALAADGFLEVVRRQLDAMPPPTCKKRGSGGRPEKKAAAKAAAIEWERATGGAAPWAGAKDSDHPVERLLNAIGRDLFPATKLKKEGTLTCEFLRVREKKSGGC